MLLFKVNEIGGKIVVVGPAENYTVFGAFEHVQYCVI